MHNNKNSFNFPNNRKKIMKKLENTCTCVLILNLQVHKTGHRGVKVDGESQLPVLGENHVQLGHVLRPVDVHAPGKELVLQHN